VWQESKEGAWRTAKNGKKGGGLVAPERASSYVLTPNICPITQAGRGVPLEKTMR